MQLMAEILYVPEPIASAVAGDGKSQVSQSPKYANPYYHCCQICVLTFTNVFISTYLFPCVVVAFDYFKKVALRRSFFVFEFQEIH